jgi:hypothetical protein
MDKKNLLGDMILRQSEEEEVLNPHDFGQRGSMEHSVLAPFLHAGMTEEDALKALKGTLVTPKNNS